MAVALMALALCASVSMGVKATAGYHFIHNRRLTHPVQLNEERKERRAHRAGPRYTPSGPGPALRIAQMRH
jgi:hypothetical protein